jgi:hypothetical protein
MPLPPETLLHADVGGIKVETNPAIDLVSERTIKELNNMCATVCQLSATNIDLSFRLNINQQTGIASLIDTWESIWKYNSKNPPTLGTYTIFDNYSIYLPTSVKDERGNTHDVNVKTCLAMISMNSYLKITDRMIACSKTSNNSFVIYLPTIPQPLIYNIVLDVIVWSN